MANLYINAHTHVIVRSWKMNLINQVQVQDEAKNIIKFNAKARKCGGNRTKRRCNCYGLTLKYLFALKGLSYKKVRDLIGVTAQSINHLVNRSKEESVNDFIYMKSFCRKLNIDYQYFQELCDEVRRIM